MNPTRGFPLALLLLVLPAFPVVWTLIRYCSLPDSNGRVRCWARHCRAVRAWFLLGLWIWCPLAEICLPVAAFWLAPVASSLLRLSIAHLLDNRVRRRGWSTGDIARMAGWGSVDPCLTILFLATGFAWMLEGRFAGSFWLLASGLTALLGPARLLSAQGLHRRRVKSGKLYVRTLQLAKTMGAPVQWIYVVPAGRGTLTRASASWRSIVLTDDFGEYLHGPELDFVIAHELSHIQNKHIQKHLVFLLLLLVSLTLLQWALAPVTAWPRAVWVSFSLLSVWASHYAVLRRFEYEADRSAARVTGNPDAAIRALTALYRKTRTPVERGRLLTLVETHPGLVDRIQALARPARISGGRGRKILSEASLPDAVLLPRR